MTQQDVSAVDALSTSELADARLTAGAEIPETLVLVDLLDAIKGFLTGLAETAKFDGSVLAEYVGELSAADAANLTDFSQSSSALLIVLAEGLAFSELVSPNARLNAFLHDGLSVVAVVSVGGEEYVVWVANADTFAHSQYAHFNFNSMCRLGSRYYGANEDGIFLLEGDDDRGENIRYFATLPTTELGNSGLKRLPRAYMGFSNSGDMHLKIITPERQEIVYRFNATAAGQTEALAKIGRGIVSRYFTFDLYNFEGGEAELGRIEFFPLYMRRLF